MFYGAPSIRSRFATAAKKAAGSGGQVSIRPSLAGQEQVVNIAEPEVQEAPEQPEDPPPRKRPASKPQTPGPRSDGGSGGHLQGGLLGDYFICLV